MLPTEKVNQIKISSPPSWVVSQVLQASRTAVNSIEGSILVTKGDNIIAEFKLAES